MPGKKKQERNAVTLEKRVKSLEKEMDKHRPETYNLLVRMIQQQSQQMQQFQQYAQNTSEFLQEKELEEQYKAWMEEKYPVVEVCTSCEGRGTIGDDEECPACHPNKVGQESENQET